MNSSNCADCVFPSSTSVLPKGAVSTTCIWIAKGSEGGERNETPRDAARNAPAFTQQLVDRINPDSDPDFCAEKKCSSGRKTMRAAPIEDLQDLDFVVCECWIAPERAGIRMSR